MGDFSGSLKDILGEEDYQELQLKNLVTKVEKGDFFPSLHMWLKSVSPDLNWDWKYIKYLIDHLQMLSDGDVRKLMISLPPRSGKKLADSTPVYTPAGWTTHGELKTGDYVYHPSGKPVQILATSEKSECNYLVSFTNGDSILSHGDHLWEVFENRNKKPKILTTKQILKKPLYSGEIGKRGSRYRFQIRNTKALEHTSKELPLDPYLFGAWLGDGSTDSPRMTYALKDKIVIDQFVHKGYPISNTQVHNITGVYSSDFWRCDFMDKLRSTGAVGSKYIPDIYKQSSIDQRLQLLAGLIDTDGHVDENCRVRFTSGSKKLAMGVYDVTLSLGFRPYVRVVPPTTSTSGIVGTKGIYVIGFQPTMDIPTVIPRKKIVRTIRQRKIAVSNIEIIENGELGQCIWVDSEDGLYLCGEQNTVTHNTELSSIHFPAYFLEKNPENRVIIGTYNQTLANKLSRRVRGICRDRVQLNPDRKAMEEWETMSGGGVRAVGVGAGIAGIGANLIILDDVVRSRKDASSVTVRNSTYSWYTDDIYTRMEPDSRVLLMACLVGDTDVLLSDGTYKKIKDIRRGDNLVTLDSENRFTTNEVLNWACMGEDETYTIKTSSHTVSGNAKHPFLTTDGYKRIRDLEVGDRLLTIKKWDTEPVSLPKMFDGSEITTDFMWWLGFMFGDGWVTSWERNNYDKIRDKYYKSKSRCVCVAKGVDENINNKVVDMFETFFSRRPELKIKEGYYRVDFNDLGRYLESIGLSSGYSAKTKRIPDWVFNSNIEFRQAFMRGFFEANGWLVKNRKKEIYTTCLCNENLVNDLKLLGYISDVRSTRIYKRETLSQPPNSPKEKLFTSYTSTFSFMEGVAEGHENNHIRLNTIKSIEKSYTELVYDIEVENDHNFIANGIISHNTRWHEDDLLGRVAKGEDRDDWTIINIPAIAEEDDILGREIGEALNPERYPIEKLYEIKRVMGRTFNALYQGHPTEQEGETFKASWFKDNYLESIFAHYEKQEKPKFEFVRYWDLASTTDGDWTVGVLMAKNRKTKEYFIADIVRGRWSSHTRDKQIKETAIRDQAVYSEYGSIKIRFEVQPGSAGKDMAKYMVKQLAGFSVKGSRVTGSKESRSEPFASQCEIGNVYVVKADWNSVWLDELCTFPLGKYDDIVDACSGAFSELSKGSSFISLGAGFLS